MLNLNLMLFRGTNASMRARANSARRVAQEAQSHSLFATQGAHEPDADDVVTEESWARQTDGGLKQGAGSGICKSPCLGIQDDQDHSGD